MLTMSYTPENFAYQNILLISFNKINCVVILYLYIKVQPPNGQEKI